MNETHYIQRTLCENGTSLTSTKYHERSTLAREYLRIVQNRGPWKTSLAVARAELSNSRVLFILAVNTKWIMREISYY